MLRGLQNRLRRRGAPLPRGSGNFEALQLQETPELREVAFATLAPSSALLSEFSELSEEALSHLLGREIFAQGKVLVERGAVKHCEAQGFYMSAEVEESEGATYAQEATITDGVLAGRCDCMRALPVGVAFPVFGAAHPPCRHISAALLALRNQNTQNNTVSTAKEAYICPVTRQTLAAGSLVFQCRQCSTTYSPEGWEFMRQSNHGRCCNCNSQNSVFSLHLPK